MKKLNQRAYQVVRDKRAWEGPREPAEAAVEAALGSKGWTTRGYLPHYDQPGTLQMITFRLADAMPASLRHEWEALQAIADERERRTKLEADLDEGHGECSLRDEEHFHKAKHYLEWNPVKAGLARRPEEWAFGSAHPRWQWSEAERYVRGQLLNRPAASTPQFRSADIPVRLGVEENEEADKNVRAPKA